MSGRRHNADDLVATALAVEPVKTVYRGRYVTVPVCSVVLMKRSVLIIRSSILTSAGRRKYRRSKIAAGAMMFQGAVKCCEIQDT